MAILQRGPIAGKGLPFFLPNATPHFYGVYSFRNIEVRAYYTEHPVLRRPEWELTACRDSEGFVIVDQGKKIFLFPAEENRWTVFFIFSQEEIESCTFIDSFLTRFRYFIGITRNRVIPPLPAVIPIE